MSSPTNAPKGMITPGKRDMRVAIVRTLWNSHIMEPLLAGALDTFKQAKIERDIIDIYEVPGAVELTFASSQLIKTGQYDCIIALGCVIRGGTPHFDYVCNSVTQGITRLNSECDVPIIFGVLTVDTQQDALDRAGGCCGNKGSEAAEAAIQMYDFMQRVKTYRLQQ